MQNTLSCVPRTRYYVVDLETRKMDGNHPTPITFMHATNPNPNKTLAKYRYW